MTVTDWLLARSAIYRLWQLPFAERKFAPIFDRRDIAVARRVLDVGCGPGTNAPHFAHADYIGIDINPNYIASALRRHGRRFLVADVTAYSVADEGKFDFIFVNSLLHHLDASAVRGLLLHLADLLTQDGHIHILDLELPAQRVSIAGILARADRGNFPRPLDGWRQLFSEVLEIIEFEPYALGLGRLTFWNMIYCKGRRR